MSLQNRVLRNRALRLVALAALSCALILPVASTMVAGSSFALMRSTSSSRSDAASLSGATLTGNAYIFLTPTTGVTKASFWLDNTAASGTATHVENYAPLDYMGTASNNSARPWNTASVTAGAHTITVKIVTSSGTTTITVGFNTGFSTASQPSAAPTAAPTATPTSAPTATATPTPTATATPTPAPTAVQTPAPTAVQTPAPTAVQTPAPTASPAPVVPTPVAPPVPAGFVGASGTNFTLGGSTFRFTGFNIYQANSRSNCSTTMGTGSALDTALNGVGPGSEVFRSWFYQSEAVTNGARDWSAFDHTLAVAKAHGKKVIVTLADQWGSCDGGSGYKTDSWYAGGYKTSTYSGWLVPYRTWVSEIVTRYKGDPTIAMWQLMNEAEIKTAKSATTCAPTSDLYNFAADVSGLVRSIDSNHLVNLGTMGAGQCGAQGGDYKLIQSIPTLTVCEYHDYGHETTALPANLVNDIAACKSLNKPIFVGESGIQVNDIASTSFANRASEFDAKCTAMFNAGLGGFLVWSWNNSPSVPASWQVGAGDPTLTVINSH
jgi:hypothetical protein